jgi:3-methyladenine DNA glycosylase AlkD
MGDRQSERDGRDQKWREIARAGKALAMERIEELEIRGFGEVRIVAAKTGMKWEITQELSERVEV